MSLTRKNGMDHYVHLWHTAVQRKHDLLMHFLIKEMPQKVMLSNSSNKMSFDLVTRK